MTTARHVGSFGKTMIPAGRWQRLGTRILQISPGDVGEQEGSEVSAAGDPKPRPWGGQTSRERGGCEAGTALWRGRGSSDGGTGGVCTRDVGAEGPAGGHGRIGSSRRVTVVAVRHVLTTVLRRDFNWCFRGGRGEGAGVRARPARRLPR